MKIGNVPGVSGVYNKPGVGKVQKSGQIESKKDVVSISGSGQDFASVMKALREVPDVRNEKVDDIANKINSGTYDVKDEDIVKKLAESILGKRV